MTYPESFQQKVGFDKIVALLQKECIMPPTRELCSRVGLIWPFDKLKTYLEQTAEFKTLLMLEAAFPSQDYYDLSEELHRLQPAGSYMTLEGLQLFRASYNTLSEIKAYFTRLDAEAYPRLCSFASYLEIQAGILPELGRLLTQTGEMRDNASERLAEIRLQIRRKSNETQRYIGQYMSQAKKEGWVDHDADVTVRNERLVIPMASAHKRSMRGFIHDVSATGQTVFMEPEEIFNLNNEIVELRNEERLEIIEILKRFATFIRPHLDSLFRAYKFLVSIDFLRAKAQLAIKLNAGLPIVENRPCIEWKQARHPLLYLNLRTEGGRARAETDGRPSEVVPLDLKLENDERIVIISGPNAGGKSVCLKTVGLLQYMLQCGFLVSMREDSQMGVFRDIFVDIGDEQSIENDLSTYSSHLKNMKFWVEHAGRQTLFLSDELGSGTEPALGGAIAEALVEHLNRKGAWGIVTTHYTNLKLMAQHHSGIVNGAMLFDQEKMLPLYIFRKGLPGSSFAFEIAQKIGLPKQVLEGASRKVGRRQLNFEQELQRIETEKHRLGQKQQELTLADELLSSTLEKYNSLLDDLQQNRSRLMKEAKAEARDLVKKANADIEKTIREIKEAGAEKEATARARRELEQWMPSAGDGEGEWTPSAKDAGREARAPYGVRASRPASFEPKRLAPTAEGTRSPSSTEGALTPGSPVKLKSGGEAIARIAQIKGNQARVDFDYMSMTLPLSDLIPLTPSQSKQYEDNQTRSSVKIENHTEGQLQFKPHIDLRGHRGEEAVAEVEKLIDEAVLYGHKYLEILHGKGNGILRQMIRAACSKNPHVAHFEDQKEEFGGSGITLIELS